jgi:two-component system phosphate regulon sensor histidine kinase PhoR
MCSILDSKYFWGKSAHSRETSCVNSSSLAIAARGLTGSRRVVFVIVILAATAILAYFLSNLATSPMRIAPWWPAAGVAVVGAASVNKKLRLPVLLLIVIVTIPALMLAGRPFGNAAIASVALVIEVWIVVKFIVDGDDRPRLTTVSDVVRFIVGVLLGATLVAVIAGTSAILTDRGEFLDAAFPIFVSHASAIVVIVPVFLVTQVNVPAGESSRRLVHAIVVSSIVLVTFSPGQFAALAFLPVPFLVWSAFSYTMSFALFEVVGISIIAYVLTSIGGGPFAQMGSGFLSATLLLELYIASLAISVILVAASRNERQTIEEQKNATAHLMYESFGQSKNGFVIVQEDQGAFRIIEANAAASALLPASLTIDDAGSVAIVVDSGLHLLLQKMTEEGTREVTVSGDDELPVTVTVSNVTNSTFGPIFIVSIIDLRAIREAEDAIQRQLEREQAVVEELKALNQQKDDFVSSVTHELRTPITTVLGFTEELETTKLDDEQRDYVAIVQRNAERLLSVVEDVLTFSRRGITTPTDTVKTAVDITAVIVTVLDDLRHSIRDKGIVVSTDSPDEPVGVFAAESHVTRVLINIVTNAVKFSPVGGSVHIVTIVADGHAEVVVSDNGPGVAPGDLDKVFDQFYRSSRAAHDGVPGTGLGLSIVRELMTGMDGSIVLESDGTSGTTARMTFPLAEASTRA